MVSKSSFLLLAALLVVGIAGRQVSDEVINARTAGINHITQEINVNQLLAEEALKYPGALDEVNESLLERTAGIDHVAQEININQLLAEEALKYPGALDDPLDTVVRAQPISRAGACSIGINSGDLTTKQPVLVVPSTGQIALPSKTGEVIIEAGKSLDMYCTASFAAPLSGKKISATCVDGNTFAADGKQVKFTDIQCTANVANTARKTARTCYNGAAILEVGFDLTDRFISLMELCHNLNEEVTYYAHYSLYTSSIAFQKSVARVGFVPGGFYNGKNVDKLYTQVQQMETIGKILGAGSEKYFDISKSIYLARGHMAAKADYIYGPEQLATFYFINVAPQWQVFNAGNWERVEAGSKIFASDRNLNLDVYTGTWGVLTLADSAGAQKPLYLAFDGTKGLIPIPKLYYRVMIDKATKAGIVIIGVNNPHATLDEIKKDYILCNDVSDKINWINWDKTNINRGYSYACEVNEFAKKIGQLPELGVRSLLY